MGAGPRLLPTLESEEGFVSRWLWLGSSAPLLVLDIETRQDALARRLSRGSSASSSTHLREIVSVSCLIRSPQKLSEEWLLRTFHREDLSEENILENVHALVLDVASRGGALVTYNVAAHDLAVLRHRQIRWWQCDRPALLDYIEKRRPHIDVMVELVRGGRKYAKLVVACASLGVALVGPARLASERSSKPYEWEKGEVDVVGTAITFLYVAADRARSNELLTKGLSSLAEFLRRSENFFPHLAHLAASYSFVPPLQRAERAQAMIGGVGKRGRRVAGA